MSTSSKTWKASERRVASFFGVLRQILSGSSGRAENTSSDSTHPKLFIECKYRDGHTTRTLWEATRQLAKEEKKTPVIALIDKGKVGFLLCIHSDDFATVAAEYAAALSDEDADNFEGQIRQAYNRRHEFTDKEA
jgi:hypothetical protein